MEKYFVSKSAMGYVVVSEEYDKENGVGNYYKTASNEFETEKEAQDFADKLNKG